LKGRDVIGCAQTGTGKTAAFCLPALQSAYETSSENAKLHTLILTPTRELAAQIGDSLSSYGSKLDLWHTVIFGGVNEKPQIAELKKGVDILVATPGRLLDLMNRGFVKLSTIKLFVLDEADRMLDMGFIHDVRKIVAALPKKRQTLFFSATMPAPIRKLASSLVTNAESVAVDPVSSTVDLVSQKLYFTDKGRKRDLLVHLLGEQRCTRSVVFARTKHGSDRVARHLLKAGISAAAIHGNKAQNNRVRTLEAFRKGELSVLVATDLAARGIDVDDISHVFNFDLPNVPETYVHRIGRTGRAGKVGVAISLCDVEERAYLSDIERLTGSALTWVDDHPYPATQTEPPTPTPSQHRKGKPLAGKVRGQAGNRNARRQGRGNAGNSAGDNRQTGGSSRRSRAHKSTARARAAATSEHRT
jgi:ATP-dependent RNA helicase RhlE